MPHSELSRAEAKRLRALRQRSQREQEGLFLAEGIRVVEELLLSGIVLRSAVVTTSLEDTDRGRQIANELAARVTVYTAAESELKQIADTETPQGVIVCAVTPRAQLPPVAPQMTLVLDAIQDPGNFGTLLRSAVAFGAGLVITLPGTVDAWNGKSIRAAAGTSFHVPIVPAALKEVEDWSRQHGIALWGAAADGESIRAMPYQEHVAIVMGNEGAGLSSGARSILHQTVALPMRGRAESLNAGVAGGILMYLLSEQSA
ncbi:MAG: RNA methyltransferase [Longimicrobiales bacterium]